MKIPTLPNLTSQVELIIKESGYCSKSAANLREQSGFEEFTIQRTENVTNFAVCVGGLVWAWTCNNCAISHKLQEDEAIDVVPPGVSDTM